MAEVAVASASVFPMRQEKVPAPAEGNSQEKESQKYCAGDPYVLTVHSRHHGTSSSELSSETVPHQFALARLALMSSPQQVDLHGLRPEAALRRVAQALHAARVQGATSLVVVTGRGWGNLRQEPILRRHVEQWLTGPEARALGVRSARVVAKGGALELRLGARNSGGDTG